MGSATHIIGRQIIRLRYNGRTDSLALRQQVSAICSDELPVRLSKLLDQYDDTDFVLRIPKLEINVTLNDDGNLQETFARTVIEQVEAALQLELGKSRTAAVSVEKSFIQSLSFYLEKGFLPWWSPVKTSAGFQQAFDEVWLSAKPSVLVQEITPLLSRASARARLLSFIDDKQWEEWIMIALGIGTEEWQAIKQSLLLLIKEMLLSTGVGAVFERQLRDILLEASAQHLTMKEALSRIVDAIVASSEAQDLSRRLQDAAPLPHAGLRQIIGTHVDATLQNTPTNQDAGTTAPPANTVSSDPDLGPDAQNIAVPNAGLVLVALYLPLFFKNIGLLNEGSLTDVSRAVAVLHYLVFGQAKFAEFEVVLEKILCGLPVVESIEAMDDITAEEKAQAEELLQSVIEHWTVLKNTTPEGLRHNFLQREGKLAFQHNQWELTVQKMAHDILLDYLPWNIRMIKLPWMPYLMVVKW